LEQYKGMALIIKEEDGFRYVEQGSGRTMLLLHGLFGALSNWQDVIERFSPEYRVIIPFLPVYELPILKSNLKSLVKFVYRFITYKELDQIHLLGNSLGGHIALMYVLEHPERISTLVLTGSSGLYENAFGGSFPKRGNYEFIKEKVEYTFYNPETASKELIDEVYELVNDRAKVIRILAMAKSAIRHNLAKSLPEIKIPVSLIWGKEDRITPPDVAIEFHKLIPNSELNWIDHCGHVPMMEQPEKFNEVLARFLEVSEPNLKVQN